MFVLSWEESSVADFVALNAAAAIYVAGAAQTFKEGNTLPARSPHGHLREAFEEHRAIVPREYPNIAEDKDAMTGPGAARMRCATTAASSKQASQQDGHTAVSCSERAVEEREGGKEDGS